MRLMRKSTPLPLAVMPVLVLGTSRGGRTGFRTCTDSEGGRMGSGRGAFVGSESSSDEELVVPVCDLSDK